MKHRKHSGIVAVGIIGVVIVIAMLLFGTLWMGWSANSDTERAVRSVSLFYLDELAGRRGQVISSNLNGHIRDLKTAVDLMEEDDLQDSPHLRQYQARMRQLYLLEKFAFVDEDGLIYTADGNQRDIENYDFDFKTISKPEVSVKNLNSQDKKAIIAIPVDRTFNGKKLKVCFMEIDMNILLEGVSLQSDANSTTFCNVYTRDGIALTGKVLGESSNQNLFDTLGSLEFDGDYSLERAKEDFKNGTEREVSFTTANGDKETLSYTAIDGTDWMLTYLIRESVISEQIESISQGIIIRSLIQSIATAVVLLGMFVAIVLMLRWSNRVALEKETAEAASLAKQQELEERLKLQEQLLEQEKRREELDSMINAMASDYRSVYHVDLDKDDAVCYRTDPTDPHHTPEGVHFPFHETFAKYAEMCVDEEFREGFLRFIEPENIRSALKETPIIAYRYLANRNGTEYYEMFRMADVRQSEKRRDEDVRALGVGFTVIDDEMRETMARNHALSEALNAAEEASKAKTEFLSRMSHEIRTPMNAIIGLDNIALHEPDLSPRTRDQLEKIGTSAQHLLTLINDILDMSRIESGRLIIKNEEFSFHKMLEQINTIFSGQCWDKGLEYNCQIIGHIDDYYIGDNTKLRQALINILGNAVKFTPAGGKVNFSVEKIAAFDGKSTLRFIIADTGIGMKKEYLPKIFDTFSQEDASNISKYGSSGLGLAITKNILELMNGKIEVESEKGKGSTFTVTVTLMDSEHKDDTGDGAELRVAKMSVLVIDDDPVACEHAKLVLEKVGIASETALSGEEAVEMVRLRHARRDPYNLILVDWKMPEMDGLETTRQIRSIVGTDSAIIILTAYRWDDILEEALTAGVDSFIGKPLFATNVLEEFREALKKKSIDLTEGDQKADLNGKRILLAEDVAINAEIMIELLKMEGMEVEHVENGKLALEAFTEHPAHYYDAVVMDVFMPEMDGMEASTAIRKAGKEDSKSIPIIAMTANAFDEDVQRSLQAGMNAHLTKPVDPENLYETLRSLIKE